MKLTDKQYDFIKWLAINVIPSLETFWLTIGFAWNLPYVEPVGITIAAVGMLLAGCIKMSKAEYEKAKQAEYEGEM